jgi:hypothetical protein
VTLQSPPVVLRAGIAITFSRSQAELGREKEGVPQDGANDWRICNDIDDKAKVNERSAVARFGFDWGMGQCIGSRYRR